MLSFDQAEQKVPKFLLRKWTFLSSAVVDLITEKIRKYWIVNLDG
jgi:hypothetical protein